MLRSIGQSTLFSPKQVDLNGNKQTNKKMLPPEHQQLFDFAFEHFSAGRWQRMHHNRLLKQMRANAAGGNGVNKAVSPSPPPSDDDTPCLAMAALSSVLLGVGCLFGTMEELRGRVESICMARTEHARQKNKTDLDDPKVRAEGEEEEEEGFLRLSYNETLSLVASLPSVLPPQLFQHNCERRVNGIPSGGGKAKAVGGAGPPPPPAGGEGKGRKGGGNAADGRKTINAQNADANNKQNVQNRITGAKHAEFDGVGASSHAVVEAQTKGGPSTKKDQQPQEEEKEESSAADASPKTPPLQPPPPSSFTMNLPQIMEAIRLFSTFQKNDRLPLQALRTVLLTMGDEPLSEAELNYLLYPFTPRGNGAGEGLTLLEYLTLFKLL